MEMRILQVIADVLMREGIAYNFHASGKGIQIDHTAFISIKGGDVHLERAILSGGRDLDYYHNDIPLADPNCFDTLIKLVKEVI